MSKREKRRVLGRGLSALIPAFDQEDGEGREPIVLIDHAKLHTNPFQPRRDFNEEEIKELADSIRAQGLLQPVLVRRKETGVYDIISGERRVRALRLLKREKVPCLVREKLSDREMMEISLVENIQREDLNEIDKAEAYHKLLSEYGYTHDQLSKQVGKSRTSVTNTLRLLQLSEEIRLLVRKSIVTMGHARALLSLANDTDRIALAKRIQKEGLSVRDVEKAAQQSSRSKAKKNIKTPQQEESEPDIAEAINKLRYKLGTPVKMRRLKNGRGVLEIEYFSTQDLTRLFNVLLLVQ